MRVALVSFDFGEYCLALANALSEHAEVALILPGREIEPIRDQFDPRVELLPFDRPRLRQPLRQAKMCKAVLGHILRVDPDVVHLQQGHLWLNPVLPLLRHRPLVVTIHDPSPHAGDRGGRKTPQSAMNLAFRRADRVIVHAEELRREVVRLRGLGPDAVHVIPHVAIGDVGAPLGTRATDADGNAVLFFGRIWPYKGLEFLIRAEPLVSAEVPDVSFLIAGQGEGLDRYRQMMVHEERFEVHNHFISLRQRADLFRRAAVVVLPYLEASQSGVVPVAYSFAKPVVATNVGGLPEVVEDGRTGMLVPPADELALADAIVALLASADLRHRLGQAGLAKLRREWSPTRVAAQTIEVYEQARAGRHQPLRGAA